MNDKKSDIDREWTPQEVEQLDFAFDGRFTTKIDGRTAPTYTRAEFASLVARYPSCFEVPEEAGDTLAARYPSMAPKAPAPRTGNPEADALAARYPTMKVGTTGR